MNYGSVKNDSYDGFKQIVSTSLNSDDWKIEKTFRRSSENEVIKGIEIDDNRNYYITVNNLKTTKSRKTENILGFESILLDIDFHNLQDETVRQKTIDTLIYAIETQEYNLPYTKINHTGRGLHFVVDVEQTSYLLEWKYYLASKSLIDHYQSEINKISRDYGISTVVEIDKIASGKPAGLRRLENTINQKNKKLVRTVLNNYDEYTLDELILTYGSFERNSKRKDTSKRTNKPVFKQTSYVKKLAQSRVNLITEYTPHNSNKRHVTLFLLYNNLIILKTPGEAKKDVLAFNNNFSRPLKKNEINHIFRHIDDNGHYWFTTDTFRDWIGIYVPTRRESRKSAKSNKDKIKKKIISLISKKTMTYQEIADKFKVSVSTVKRYAKESKK